MNLKNLFFTILFLAIYTTVSAQETTWKIDRSHSSIAFEVLHFKIATIKGSFNEFSGKVTSNGQNFTDANFNMIIKTASVNTNQKTRDKHLRSAEFLDAEKNPEITFTSTAVTKNDDNTYAIKGDLLINGISKEFEFSGTFKGSFFHPRFKKTIGVFNLSGSIPRLDYNIGKKYPSAAMSADIEVSVNIEMIQEVQ